MGFGIEGELRQIVDTRCDPLASANVVDHGLDRPSGLDFGDFNGAGEFGAYFGHEVTPSLWEIRRATPELLPGGCSWDAHEPPAHCLIDTDSGLDVVVFDPYSESLFFTDSERVFRVRPEEGEDPVPFADSLGNVNAGGISFTRAGVMLFSEGDNDTLSVIDGWRYTFIRGDANGDLDVNLSDSQYIDEWLFRGGPEPPCWDTADVDDSSQINITDSIYLRNFLFLGGPPPPPPYPGFGVDPTGDLLGCREYDPSREIPW